MQVRTSERIIRAESRVVFCDLLGQDAGVGWVGRDGDLRPQTAFCPYLGMLVFNQRAFFPANATGIRTRDLPILKNRPQTI